MGATAVYARLSRDKEGRAENIETQHRRGGKYALEHWPEQPIRYYSDNDLTAADPDVFRPDYDRLLHDIRAGHISNVVTAEQSRLTRQPEEWEQLIVVLARAKIAEVHCYRRGGIIQVLGSKLVGRIMSAVNAEEVEILKARVTEQLDERAQQGRPHGGSPFAYRHTVGPDGHKHLEVVPERRDVVVETADRLLAGWSLTAVADDLNARSVPTARGGKKWTASSVRSMVTNPTVAGLRTHRGKLTPGTWQPVIPEDTWRALQHLLTAPVVLSTAKGVYRATRSRTAPRRRYLLTGGMAVCGVCYAPLAGQQRQGRDGARIPTYACHPATGGRCCVAIMAEPLEAHVAKELCKELDRPGFWDAYMEDSDQRDDLLARFASVTQRETENARRWAAGDIKSHEWEAARAVLQAELAGIEAQLASIPPPVALGSGADLRADWHSMPLGEKRKILDFVKTQVVVGRATPGVRSFDSGRVQVGFR